MDILAMLWANKLESLIFILAAAMLFFFAAETHFRSRREAKRLSDEKIDRLKFCVEAQVEAKQAARIAEEVIKSVGKMKAANNVQSA